MPLPQAELDLVTSLGEASMPRVAILLGSLRRDSLNGHLAREARNILAERADVDIIIPDVPLFSQDYEVEGEEPSSPAARWLRGALREADGVLVAAPEYDRLPSAVVLNACHWVSRPPDRPLRDKPVMLAGVSSGDGATRAARPALRLALERVGAKVLSEEIFVPRGEDLWEDEGALRDFRVELRDKLQTLVMALS